MCNLISARSGQKRNLDLELDLNPPFKKGLEPVPNIGRNLINQISFKFGYVQASGYTYKK